MTKQLRLCFNLCFIALLSGFMLLSSKQVSAICNIPTGLSTTNITSTSATFHWSATVCDSFLVRYNVYGTANYYYKKVKPGTATSVVINGLYPLTNYSWVVHTYCSGGTSGGYQQSPANFTTTAGAVNCVIPNNTTTTLIGPNSAVLSWNSAITADSFLIRYAVHNTTNYVWKTVPGSVHSYTLLNLPPNTSYDWRVRCICASNPVQSYSVLNTFTTLSSNCGTADSYYFTNNNIGYSSAVAQWSPVAGAVSYNLRYCVRYSNNWITVSSTGITKGITGLSPSTWYEWQIQVVCSSGAGAWSNSGIFQTTTATIALTRGPYLQLSTTSSIYIRWRTNLATDSKVRYGTSASDLKNFAMKIPAMKHIERDGMNINRSP